ncbi:MAG: serine hydrolase [Pseudomonadota bacterium]
MRWSSLILSSLCFSGFISLLPTQTLASDPVPLPDPTTQTDWPTETWIRASVPEQQEAALAEILDPVFATEVGEGLGETRAVLIIQDGQLVYERYRDGITPDTRHVSWSVAKSLTTTLVGRAVQTGLIASIDDPMPAAFEVGDPRRNISWRHWVQLLDGLDYAEYGVTELMDNDAALMMFGPGRFDQLAYARENFPLAHKTGKRWNYSTVTFHLVARALQSLLPGTCVDPEADPATCLANPQVMKHWVDEALFNPLGIDGVIEFDSAGTFLGGSSTYMRAEDYARFGLFLLRDGIWEEERLLPEDWVDFNRTAPADSDMNGYGAGFWLAPENNDNPRIQYSPPHDAFHAGGREGQLVWIVPSRNLVITRVGLMPDSPENWNALYRLAQNIGAALD